MLARRTLRSVNITDEALAGAVAPAAAVLTVVGVPIAAVAVDSTAVVAMPTAAMAADFTAVAADTSAARV